MDIIKINNLNKSYANKQALIDISLSVKENTLFGLLGENGAGKSTLIKILSGLIQKDSGEVTIDGHSLDKSLPCIQRIINISPQESAIAPNLNVKENLEFFADIYGKKDKDRIQRIIDSFSLNEVLHQKAKTLSGGYKRRLSIAISLVSEPKILFLDEPTLGLDVLARRELWKIIRSLKGKITIVLTSHYLEEIEALCDDVAILSKGRLLARGNVDHIKELGHSSSFEDAFVSIIEGGEKE